MYLAFANEEHQPIYAGAHPLDVHAHAGSRPGRPKLRVCAACLAGRFSNLTRSRCGLDHAFTTASRPRCLPCSSRGSRLDVEVLRRPRWRWRPAHSSAASTHDRASSRVPTGLGQTHRRCLRPGGRRCTRCRASGERWLRQPSQLPRSGALAPGRELARSRRELEREPAPSRSGSGRAAPGREPESQVWLQHRTARAMPDLFAARIRLPSPTPL